MSVGAGQYTYVAITDSLYNICLKKKERKGKGKAREKRCTPGIYANVMNKIKGNRPNQNLCQSENMCAKQFL